MYPNLVVKTERPSQATLDEGEWALLNTGSKPTPLLAFKRSGLVEGRLRHELNRAFTERTTQSQAPRHTPLLPKKDRYAKYQEQDGRPVDAAQANLYQTFLPTSHSSTAPQNVSAKDNPLRVLRRRLAGVQTLSIS